jgi:hypothetical protein
MTLFRIAASNAAKEIRFRSSYPLILTLLLPVSHGHLNTRVRLDLEADGGADLLPRLDWSVQEDPSLDEASPEEVREQVFTSSFFHS